MAADQFALDRGQRPLTVDRAVHGDRLLAALDRDLRELLELDPRPRPVASGLVAERVSQGRLHQASGNIHGIAQECIFAPPRAADRAAEHPAGRDPDRPAEPQFH